MGYITLKQTFGMTNKPTLTLSVVSQMNTLTVGHYLATHETSHGYSHIALKTLELAVGAKRGIRFDQLQHNFRGKQSYGAPLKKILSDR